MKALVTCGPTWAAIDDVRVISNTSSGEMGHFIAREFKNHKVNVTLLEGQVTHQADLRGVRVVKYTYFEELAQRLEEECLKKYDVIVHAAAVSDFIVKRRLRGKVSSGKEFKLTLTSTPKLINMIKLWSPKSFVVGFKLEPEITPKYFENLTQKLFLEAQCDLVVANQSKRKYMGYILNADFEVLAKSARKQEIAKLLVRNLL